MKIYLHKILLLSFIILTPLLAQDFNDIKIYINPGHGGHDSNDRYISATGFWESEGNLTKGLYLRDLLENLGATVIMSRILNRTEDDRSLSEIDAEANANNVDYFHSIHSNAHNETANYPLLLFRGKDSAPVFPDAKRMGHIMWTEMNKINHQWTYWGYSWENNRGDWDFYPQWGTSGLGVLRTLEMPGTLSEGSFHDYVPNSWRLQCIDYRKHEGIVILRSFIDYFGLDPLPHGTVAGLVRAENLNVDYSYNYNSGLPNDKKQTLDYAKVTLLPDNKVYITDGNKNGFYMFDSLEAGSYSVVFDAGEFKADTVKFTVTADETSFANGFLEQDPDKPPMIFNTFPEDTAEQVDTYATIQVNFSRPMDVSSTEKAFSILPQKHGTFSWQDDNRTLLFRPDSAYALSEHYIVTLSDSARSSFGVNLNSDYSFSFHTAATHNYPQVFAFYPSASVDSAFTHTEISLEFTQSMNTEETEKAFTIFPPATGSYTWQNENRKLNFELFNPLIADTNYRVTLLKSAKNTYFVELQDSFTFSFKTRKRNKLELIRSFPFDGQEEVSQSMYFYLQFDNKIDENTFSTDNFELRSEVGEKIYLRKLTLSSDAGTERITFKPKDELERKTNYTLFIYPGISAPDGFQVQDTLTIKFKSDPVHFVSGSLLDGFENLTDWRDPLTDEMTVGIDSTRTYFIKTNSTKINGSYAARLIYGFEKDSAGVCRLYNFSRPSIGDDIASEFGIWVFGDFSKNWLDFWFDHGDSSDVSIVQKKIDWYGWKLVHFPISSIEGAGEVFFQSLVIRQDAEGLIGSEIYFDDLQSNVVVGIERLSGPSISTNEFKLAQSYPNPFNPETTIEFVLPYSTKAELVIYNVIGQKVKELMSSVLPAGSYRYRFKANNLASGIYIYELKTDHRVLRKRMVYLK